MKSDFMKALALCWNLESLDISSCCHVDEQGFVALSKGEVNLRVGLPPS